VKTTLLPEPPPASLVREELSLILKSPSFRGSKRCQEFLQHVVGKALDGDTEGLKERTLAIEIFGRKADADLTDDSIVRVGAREVRKRLAQYYVTDGAADPLRIDLPAGSYVPAFQNGHTAIVAPPVTAVEPQRASRSYLYASLAVLAIAIVGGFAWRSAHALPADFQAFWQPVFDQPSPVLLALAHPIVYHPSTRASRLNEVQNPAPPGAPLQRPLQLPAEALDGSDFVPAIDQYVGFGDTVVAFRLAGLFAKHSQPARIRLASKMDFSEMRDASTVLIGAFTNRWTLELTKDFRFIFDYPEGKPAILDKREHKQWALNGKSDNGRSADDYILICRLPHAQSGGFVVIGAGLTQYGTQEAGRILGEPETLVPILAKLPSTWKDQNMQLVLHSRVVADTPTPPEVVAYHLW